MHGEISRNRSNFANAVIAVISPRGKGNEPVSEDDPSEPFCFRRFDKCAVVGDFYNQVRDGDPLNLTNLSPHRAVPFSAGPVYEVAYLSYIGGCGLLINVSVIVPYFKYSVKRLCNRFVFIRLDFLFDNLSFFFSQHIPVFPLNRSQFASGFLYRSDEATAGDECAVALQFVFPSRFSMAFALFSATDA